MSQEEILCDLLAAVQRHSPAALATVIHATDGTPARPGFKLLVTSDGLAKGNVGGGVLETRIRASTQEVLTTGRAQTFHYTLREAGADALGMLCGGEVTVFVEPYLPKPTLLLVGGGHIGQPLAELGQIVGYEVLVVDVRPERGDLPGFDAATVTNSTYIVLITEDHTTDEDALRQALETPAAYIGMIGSRRKTGIILDHLRRDGFTEQALSHVRAPIGLDLGGRRPAEIALAILAEIEAVRHGGSGLPRSTVLTNEPAASSVYPATDPNNRSA